MYLVLQGTDLGRETDEVEEVLLETEWYAGFVLFRDLFVLNVFFFLRRSSDDIEVAREASARIQALFLQ